MPLYKDDPKQYNRLQYKKRGKYLRRYYKKNKNKYSAQREKWRHENPEKWNLLLRKSRLKTYGLTQNDYDRMISEQADLCKICGGPQLPHLKYLSIDHDHITGIVRGLLCSQCNVNLGWLERYQVSIDGYLRKK